MVANSRPFYPPMALWEIEQLVARVRELEAVREFVADLASHGVRFDLNPTIDYSRLAASYTAYIARIDTSIRERAARALGGGLDHAG